MSPNFLFGLIFSEICFRASYGLEGNYRHTILHGVKMAAVFEKMFMATICEYICIAGNLLINTAKMTL